MEHREVRFTDAISNAIIVLIESKANCLKMTFKS